MDPIEKLRQLLRTEMRNMAPPTVVWATCKSVNTQDGTMVAEREGLDYEDVIIGLGGNRQVPKASSRVLLGIIEGKRQAAFLIWADTQELHLNGDAHGGLVKAEELASRLNALEQDINNLKLVFSTWAPVTQDGGAALKGAAATWYAQQLTTTTSQQLQNTQVQHG